MCGDGLHSFIAKGEISFYKTALDIRSLIRLISCKARVDLRILDDKFQK